MELLQKFFVYLDWLRALLFYIHPDYDIRKHSTFYENVVYNF